MYSILVQLEELKGVAKVQEDGRELVGALNAGEL